MRKWEIGIRRTAHGAGHKVKGARLTAHGAGHKVKGERIKVEGERWKDR
jgi:hypothetical protein